MDDIKIIEQGDLKYIQFTKLLEHNIKHYITLKPLDFNINKKEFDSNIKKLCNTLKLNYNGYAVLKQMHSDKIITIKNNNYTKSPADGFITNLKDKPLITYEADCTPVIMYDPVKKVIANIHSGWRGTLSEIAKKAVIKLKEEYQIDAKNLICCIGPHIKECCFEVDEEVKKSFQDKFGNKYIRKGNIKDNKQKYFINTLDIIKDGLYEVGVQKDNLIATDICTVCDDRCHSYRKDKDASGRSITVITL